MYAPCVGAVGFDLSRIRSRRMFAESRNRPVNAPTPVYPELSGYAVCQIRNGMKCFSVEIIFSSYSCNFCILGKKTLLDYSNDAGFIVLGNKPGMNIEMCKL